jgi:hypothetical protein
MSPARSSRHACWTKGASAQQQRWAVGVNLVTARFSESVPEEPVESLLDNLGFRASPEIDMLEFSGIEFRNVDNRVMALCSCRSGRAAQPCSARRRCRAVDMLYGWPCWSRRGSFRPVTYVNPDMVEARWQSLSKTRGNGQAHPRSWNRPCAICWPAERS